MDNDSINRILQTGLNEIDNDLALHEEIRAVAKELANRLMFEGRVEEYIVDEYGNEHL